MKRDEFSNLEGNLGTATETELLAIHKPIAVVDISSTALDFFSSVANAEGLFFLRSAVLFSLQLDVSCMQLQFKRPNSML